jgi:hypothetical protein
MARSSLPQAQRCGQHCPSSVSTRSRVPGPLGPLDSIDQRLSGRDVFVVITADGFVVEDAVAENRLQLIPNARVGSPADSE